EIYTLSLHDALPISGWVQSCAVRHARYRGRNSAPLCAINPQLSGICHPVVCITEKRIKAGERATGCKAWLQVQVSTGQLRYRSIAVACLITVLLRFRSAQPKYRSMVW